MSHSLLDAIGNTPLVEIRRVNPNPGVRILAKLEYMNPGGSIKDRAAQYIIEEAEASGRLTPGKTVIEATSGNTGIGLAMVCAVKGYKLLLAMSESASLERRQILEARGAEILLTPGHMGTDGAIEEVYRLAREYPHEYFMADQYNTDANWKAHYFGTAVEIWEQTGGDIDVLVATMGTTGTLMGLSRRLKEYRPGIRIVGVEPYLGHKIQGLKNMKEAYEPGLYDRARLDEKVNVEDEDAFEMARRLAREEGLLVGMSGGAAMAIAVREAERMESGTIVVILPDGGERYLSTSLFTVRHHLNLRLFNTLSRSKEIFSPLVRGKATVYSCGPTAHARLHPGHWRRFVFADLLCRYLEFRGLKVKHVMNITDLDDNTIEGSAAVGMGLAEFTQGHIDAFHRDLEILGIRPADHYPRASEHVSDMVDLAGKLLHKGVAYEKLRSLYFDISKFPEYGRLSRVDLEKIRVGATVDLDVYEKENPRDFTLFKRCRLEELKRGLYTPTEWGNSRPSWHIQCAAMSMKYLGETFDIHTSGRELTFPHHENEIAIATALTGKPLARVWMHCDRVLLEGRKMEGSAAVPSLEELMAAGYSGADIRYWLLSTHYRKPVRFSTAQLDAAQRSLARLNAGIRSLRAVTGGEPCPDLDQLRYDLRQGFISALDDDLNISAALAVLFRMTRRIQGLTRERKINPAGASSLLMVFRKMDAVLRVFDFGEEYRDATVADLLRRRSEALRAGNRSEADRLRAELLALGVAVQDGPVAALLRSRKEARRAGNWAEADRLRGELLGLGVAVRDEAVS